MQVSLRVLTGKSEGKDIKIKKSRFLIGRHEDCHLRPKTDSVSRRHCEIVIEDERAFVADLGSKNGTYVNDERVEGKRELQQGDLLRVGKMRFELRIDAEDGSSKSDGSTKIVLDGDITDWLEEADVRAAEARIGEPETRQFRASDLETIATGDAQEKEPATAQDAKQGEDAKKGDAAKQKLARHTPPSSDNSRDAAADMLKRYFNRT